MDKLDDREKNRRIKLIVDHYPNSILLRSPESWTVDSDIDILLPHDSIGSQERIKLDDVIVDLFYGAYVQCGFILLYPENIKGVNKLEIDLECALFQIKDFLFLGGFREKKYNYYSQSVQSSFKFIRHPLFRMASCVRGKYSYLVIKTILWTYAKIHLYIWSRWFGKNSSSTGFTREITTYDSSSIRAIQ